jgi:type II secretion system protein G
MTSLKRKQHGFTIVELLIVIVVIGILAALVITTFTGIQKKARNTERQTDIKAIHGQVEAYYAQNGRYPSLTEINGAAFRTANMKGLDEEALKDPKGTAATLVSDPTASAYAYAVKNDGGTSCEADATTCSKYVLTATLEDAAAFSKNSLN